MFRSKVVKMRSKILLGSAHYAEVVLIDATKCERCHLYGAVNQECGGVVPAAQQLRRRGDKTPEYGCCSHSGAARQPVLMATCRSQWLHAADMAVMSVRGGAEMREMRSCHGTRRGPPQSDKHRWRHWQIIGSLTSILVLVTPAFYITVSNHPIRLHSWRLPCARPVDESWRSGAERRCEQHTAARFLALCSHQRTPPSAALSSTAQVPDGS